MSDHRLAAVETADARAEKVMLRAEKMDGEEMQCPNCGAKVYRDSGGIFCVECSWTIDFFTLDKVVP